MTGRPVKQSEDPAFMRTLVIASLIGCLLFLIIAFVRGGDLLVPGLCSLSALLVTGGVFGWYGKAAGEDQS